MKESGRRPRVAVLDDYQDAALRAADWGLLQREADVHVFRDHVSDERALVERLAGFDVVIAMRERTPFPRALLAQLPCLRWLVTTGSRNASIDVDAARRARHHGVRHRGAALPHRGADLGLILALARRNLLEWPRPLP